MDITNLQIVEAGDLEFYIEFQIDGHNLHTSNLPRSATTADVRKTILQRANRWKTSRADENFLSLVEFVKTIHLSV